jgi:hypothetical protein
MYLAPKPHSTSLCQHINHPITAQISCLCTIPVPHFQSVYSCSSSCYPGSCMFYIFTTTHRQTVLHIALYILVSHSLKLLCQTFLLLHMVAQMVVWLTTCWMGQGPSPSGAIFFTHAQTGPGALPASCTMDTVSFPGVKQQVSGADHTLLLARSSRIKKAILPPPSRPLVACYRVTFVLLRYTPFDNHSAINRSQYCIYSNTRQVFLT